MSPRVDRGYPNLVPRRGRALAVWGGKRGAVVSGDVGEGVEEEVSDAFPQSGRLDQGGRPDALGGAGGTEGQHLLVPESPEVPRYRCGVVQGVGFGRCGRWCGVCRKRCYQKAKGRDVYPRVQVNGLGCVCCVGAVCKCVVA